MRWAFWFGSGATVVGMWLLFRSVDLSGQADQAPLYGGAGLFLVGMLLMGWGLGASDG